MKNNQDSLLNRMTGFLVQNANPSIVYHVKNDILNNITDDEKKIYKIEFCRKK